MTPRYGRRQALSALGAVGIGGLLAACSGDDDSGDSSDGDRESGGAGAATTTSTTTSAAAVSDLASRFEDATSCSLTPEAMEGPYYLDLDLVREDIREDQEGVPLVLGIRALAADCTPIAGAAVDIWQCNGTGIYSGYEAVSEQGGAGGPSTDNETYCRGTQLTDADGIARFTTIYPGWYPGRTIHIHAKVHISNTAVLTTQLYFDEQVSDAVFESEPYASDSGRDTRNDNDGLFFPDTLLTLSEDGDGYLGLITLVAAS